ncbi:hypothetical protein LBMAG21_05360 [Armatimonadota bacterium]|nr:hypothetical protein LBMAG21_05360 [Armatimonadota bacterium]
MTTREKLIQCFSTVMPTISLEEIPNASIEGTDPWDSVVSVTLVFAVEEDFEVEIAPEDLDGLASFAKILAYLEAKGV